jgi:hypothetical protein
MSNRNNRLKRRLEGLSTPPMRARHDSPIVDLASGDEVRVHATAEAIEAGLAGLVGEVIGMSAEPEAGIPVIGANVEGGAVNVSFKDREGTFWFAKNQLEAMNQPPAAPVESEAAAEEAAVAAKPKPWWRFGL